MKTKRVLCFLLAVFIAGFCHYPRLSVTAEQAAADGAQTQTKVENEKYALYVEVDGTVSLYVKATGEWWRSNPAESELTGSVNGIIKMQMTSQLIVNYVADGKNEKQATSRASATNSDGVTVFESGNGIRVEYDFKDEEFTVSLLYTLTDNGLKAEILNSEIDERGDNRISKIVLLPYWGGRFRQGKRVLSCAGRLRCFDKLQQRQKHIGLSANGIQYR